MLDAIKNHYPAIAIVALCILGAFYALAWVGTRRQHSPKRISETLPGVSKTHGIPAPDASLIFNVRWGLYK